MTQELILIEAHVKIIGLIPGGREMRDVSLYPDIIGYRIKDG
jgi:hypothetical protein